MSEMSDTEGINKHQLHYIKWFEAFLSTIVKQFEEDDFDNTTCELLITNLKIFKKKKLKVLLSMQNHLLRIIDICLDTKFTSKHVDVDRMEVVIRIVRIFKHLEFSTTSDNSKSSSTPTQLRLPFLEVLVDFKNHVEELPLVVKRLEVILIFIAEMGNNFRGIINYSDKLETIVEDVIPEIVLLDKLKLTSYLMSICDVQYRITRSPSLIRKVWHRSLLKALENESYIETYLMILAHFLHSEIDPTEKSIVANSDEFWTALKKFFQKDAILRKRAIAVLKSVIANCDLKQEHISWWKTYLTIADELNEKQSHIVLPVLRLVKGLAKDEDIEIDKFWILTLIDQAATHDSRTVRIETLMCLFELDVNQFHCDHFSCLIRIMRTLNDSILIRKMFQTKVFDTFKDCFMKWIKDFSLISNGEYFSTLLFTDIVSQKWSPVPLFYILEILSQCYVGPQFTCDKTMEIFMYNVTHSHNIVVRSAVQVLFLRIIFNCKDSEFETVIQVFELLNLFNEKECLERGNSTWSMICDFIRSCAKYESAEKWLTSELSSKLGCKERLLNNTLSALARNILLLHDAFGLLDSSKRIREYFSQIVTSFKNARLNPYTDTKVQDNYLKLIIYILNYSRMPFETPNVILLIGQNSVDILTYVLERIEKNSQNFTLVDFYIFCLEEFSNNGDFLSDQNVAQTIRERLLRISKDMSQYHCLLLMQWICELSKKGRIQPENWRRSVDLKFCELVKMKRKKSFILTRQTDGNQSVAVSKYMNAFWTMFGWFVEGKRLNLLEFFDSNLIFDLVFESLDLARRENLVFVFRTLKLICKNEDILGHEELVMRIIDDSWKRLEEIQTTSHFQCTMKYWIEAFIQLPLVRLQLFQTKIIDYVDKLLSRGAQDGGQSFKSVAIVLEQLSKIEAVHVVYPQVTEILVSAFCCTHISRSDQRIEYDTMDHVHSLYNNYLLDEVLESNFVHVPEEVRLRSLDLMLNAVRKGISSKICLSMIQSLTSVSDSCKKRYFGDSLFHRKKHKQLQLLLILESVLNENYDANCISVMKYYEKIYSFVIHSLLVEPHQPSVRYMLEWLLMRVIIHRINVFEDKFWTSFSEASDERIGSICSFISVAFHVAKALGQERFIDMAVKCTLPWSMAQHFNARLYAQTALVKLLNFNANVKRKYGFLEDCLVSCLKRGNAVKNSIKLQEDFYFQNFHPVDHFSLQTILWELPRLSSISRDEWIPVNLFSRFLNEDCGIRLCDGANSLKMFECSSWVAKASATTRDEMEKFTNVNDIQRKYFPSVEDLMTSDTKKRSKLVVVASLIDRPANLGGLTRTCEIFAASKLVLDSLDVVRNKEFTSLSITAEKHVPLVEVKHYNLFSYLKTMKENKYFIVGIEQATNSSSLGDFVFPWRSVIVLGNEKEGIPADLLPVLDVCIEIPQMGVIRSLNVHVSASLIIWEYSKQHILAST